MCNKITTSFSESSATRTRNVFLATIGSDRSAWLTSSVAFSICSSVFALQSETKCRTLIDDAFGPDFPLMPLNDPLDGRQSDAGSAKFILVMQSGKRGK